MNGDNSVKALTLLSEALALAQQAVALLDGAVLRGWKFCFGSDCFC